MTGPVVHEYGDRGVLLELDSLRDVMAWAATLAAYDLPGTCEVVPAARTVLVLADSRPHADAVRRLIGEIEARPVEPGSDDDAVLIPVSYDGPDLAVVAKATGLTPRGVVAAHTGSRWRVAFTGSTPGFGYLVGGDPRLRMSGQGNRRTVPSGSVGLAGVFSGVYPRTSAGGWHLIGRTDLATWDLAHDPPALLRPGAWVRFVDVKATA